MTELSYEHRELITKLTKALERLDFLESFNEHIMTR